MPNIKLTPLSIQEALKTYGGNVKFFGTNEPLEDMAAFLKSRNISRVLGCSAGGDQCLTILGAAQNLRYFYAFDINPGQLFILACKARIIAEKDLHEFRPSLEKICSESENQVFQLHLRTVEITKAMNRKTKKIIPLPSQFKDKYVSVMGHTNFTDKPVYWSKNKLLLSAIRKNLKKLKFICMDLQLMAQAFPASHFDLIYLSDIFLPPVVSKHWLTRLKMILESLRKGGMVLGYQEFSYDKSIIEFLRQNAKSFRLKELYARNGMIVLEKLG